MTREHVDPALVRQTLLLGLQHHQAGQLKEAETLYRRVLASDPNNPDALHLLGAIALSAGDPGAAASMIRRAIEINPHAAIYHSNLGHALTQLGQIEEAIVVLNRAIALQPDLADAHSNLGNALHKANQFHEAIAACSKAISLKPDLDVAHSNLGTALTSLGRLDEAVDAYRRALKITPAHALIHHSLGATLLLKGDFQNGWPEMEWRWKAGAVGPFQPADFAQPMWDGIDPRGRRILLYAEQGFGDTIHFSRYIPLVAARGASLVVLCPKELTRLFRSSFPGSDIELIDDPLQAGHFDLQCPLMSLPLIFKTDLQTIPRTVPYLRADPVLANQWRARMKTESNVKVGLAWTGRPTHPNDRNRSIPPNDLAPLTEVRHVDFFNLQLPTAIARQAQQWMPQLQLIDQADHIKDFADTAAIIENLDLVITVDTAIAHLAGAMGKPVWVLLPSAPDWRWMLNRNDSPWYPTLRLFRQTTQGDWPAPIAEVVRALRSFNAGLANRR